LFVVALQEIGNYTKGKPEVMKKAVVQSPQQKSRTTSRDLHADHLRQSGLPIRQNPRLPALTLQQVSLCTWIGNNPNLYIAY
jgi:hypothetical protein